MKYLVDMKCFESIMKCNLNLPQLYNLFINNLVIEDLISSTNFHSNKL